MRRNRSEDHWVKIRGKCSCINEFYNSRFQKVMTKTGFDGSLLSKTTEKCIQFCDHCVTQSTQEIQPCSRSGREGAHPRPMMRSGGVGVILSMNNAKFQKSEVNPDARFNGLSCGWRPIGTCPFLVDCGLWAG